MKYHLLGLLTALISLPVFAMPYLKPGEWQAVATNPYATVHYHYCFRGPVSIGRMLGQAQRKGCRLVGAVSYQGRTIVAHEQCHIATPHGAVASDIESRQTVNAPGTAVSGVVRVHTQVGGYSTRTRERFSSHWVGACPRLP